MQLATRPQDQTDEAQSETAARKEGSEMIKVYGASDDLIEIEGDIREEFDTYDAENFLTFNDGTVLHVKYDDPGIWKVNRVQNGSATYCKIYEADEGSEERGEGYTDIVTLVGAIKSVCLSEVKP
jgi:hypothetical protein